MSTTNATNEYSPDWSKAVTLFRTSGNGWDRARFDQFWVETMVRRFANHHPGFLNEWLSVSAWMRVLLRRVQPGDPHQHDWLENEVRKFLTRGENRIGSENPWRVMSRVVQKSGYKLTEYSITHVPQFEKDLQPTANPSNADPQSRIEWLGMKI
jgi:hypothetical protein